MGNSSSCCKEVNDEDKNQVVSKVKTMNPLLNDMDNVSFISIRFENGLVEPISHTQGSASKIPKLVSESTKSNSDNTKMVNLKKEMFVRDPTL